VTHQTFPKPGPKPKRRRRPLNPLSERRIKYQDELDALTPALLARCSGICEICGAAGASHRHHKLRRGQGGKNTMANILMLCDGCHFAVHEFPSVSYANGWLLRKNT
jgi:5-methylcytosine-specific restriction endonuclease McrA